MKILGLGYYVAHDSNVAVVSHNTLDFACAEERLSRHRRDGSFPSLGTYCAKTNYGTPDVTVAPYFDECRYRQEYARTLDRGRCLKLSNLQRSHEQTLRRAGVTEFLGHHYSHAAGAFYSSGFDKAIVVTYDGGITCEPWLATVWEGDGLRLKPVRQLTYEDGANAAVRYSGITSLLGFQPIHDEGKVMGLAAAASPDAACIEELTSSCSRIRDVSSYYSGLFAFMFKDLIDRFPRSVISASIQHMTEDAVTQLIKDCVPDPTGTNCVMAGGLFANVRANLAVKRLGFKNLYVYPAMGDEGLGAGAAMGYLAMNGVKPAPLTHAFLGPSYTCNEIQDTLNRIGLAYTRDADIEIRVARLLLEGYAVGRFTGRMEFGPRALGNRSILYRADDMSAQSKLNEMLHRSETMPFAPATRGENAAEMYLELDGLERCTSFMTTVVPCTDRMKQLSPGAVHVDGTARPLIVWSENNPSLHRILSEYYRLSGSPSIINTSFNMHGEPIVCSPSDAIGCFLRSGLDYLAIEDFLILSPQLADKPTS